jgi:hypothetical protein
MGVAMVISVDVAAGTGGGFSRTPVDSGGDLSPNFVRVAESAVTSNMVLAAARSQRSCRVRYTAKSTRFVSLRRAYVARGG